jgi:hypothetical protein
MFLRNVGNHLHARLYGVTRHQMTDNNELDKSCYTYDIHAATSYLVSRVIIYSLNVTFWKRT